LADYRRVGEILLEKGKLTQEQLDIGLATRKGQRRRLGRILTDLGFVSDRDIAGCLGEQYELDVIDPCRVTPDQAALNLLSGEVALERRVLPLRFSPGNLECIIADPIDFPTTDMIGRMAGRRTVFHIAPESELVESIRKAYKLTTRRSKAHRPTRTVAGRPGPRAATDQETILARLDTITSRSV